MSSEQWIKILVMITLIEMMLAIGLSVAISDVYRIFRNWRLTVVALLVNFVCVPLVTLALLWLAKAPPLVCAGFLILAVCPGAAYGPPLTAYAKGDIPTSVGLMTIMAMLTVVLAPLLLSVLLPLTSWSDPIPFNTTKLIGVLLATQLAPLSAGLAIRFKFPAFAERILGYAQRLGVCLNLAAFGLIVATQTEHFAQVRPRILLGMTVLYLATLGLGWHFGGKELAIRRTLTLTTCLRNMGLSMVIVTGAFANTPAVLAVLGYGLFGIFSSLLLSAWWHWQSIPKYRQALS